MNRPPRRWVRVSLVLILLGLYGSLLLPVARSQPGRPGFPGRPGVTGISGISGRTPGFSGISGISGNGIAGRPPGFSGISGIHGAHGIHGVNGIAGMPGTGISGIHGMSGGISGISGMPGMPAMPGTPRTPGMPTMPHDPRPEWVHTCGRCGAVLATSRDMVVRDATCPRCGLHYHNGIAHGSRDWTPPPGQGQPTPRPTRPAEPPPEAAPPENTEAADALTRDIRSFLTSPSPVSVDQSPASPRRPSGTVEPSPDTTSVSPTTPRSSSATNTTEPQATTSSRGWTTLWVIVALFVGLLGFGCLAAVVWLILGSRA